MTSGELAPLGFEYAPAPEPREIVRLEQSYGLYVGGEWRAAEESYTTLSPADETPLADIGQAGEADVDAAVAATHSAFELDADEVEAVVYGGTGR